MDTPSYYQTPPSYEMPSKPKVTWKLIIIITVAVVLIAAIIMGVSWLVQNRNQATQNEAAALLAEQELNQALSTCDEERNPEACRATLIEAAAQNNGVAEVCTELEGQAMISCVWKVARESYQAAACDLIDDNETQKECADSVYRALALRDLDISRCEQISGDITRERCVSTLSEEIAKTKGCSGTGVDQTVCDQQKNLAEAVASEDPDRCAALSDSGDQGTCLDTVGSGDRDHDDLNAELEASLGSSDTSLDSDGDGLSDADEYNLYHTDPSKVDTDGDGYSDKDELESGYNPLGPGKL
ncbi:MAG: hypothetical protein WC702_01925 [Patescibacteria group bacterium]|jgi:hypothetical protein